MSDKTLRWRVIRLAYRNPGPVRDALMPILKGSRTAGLDGGIQEALTALDQLSDLSESLSEVTDAFGLHFKMANIDPEVRSQQKALEKAREGLRLAQGVLQDLQKLSALSPEDKTVIRALKDADTMVRRFERHKADANRMISTLSKKALPPTLLKMGKAVEAGIKRQLEDPKALQVIYWTVTDRVYGHTRNLDGAAYQIVFRIDDPSISSGQTQDNRAQTILQESTIRPIGPYIYMAYNRDPSPTTAKDAVANFVGMLRGYAGLKGERDRTLGRTQVAKSIQVALATWMRKLGEAAPVEVASGGLYVRSSFRTGNRWENEGSWAMESDLPPVEEGHVKSLTQHLSAWKAQIEHVQVSYGEKGWFSVDVKLK